jgi:hypothetical protein
MTKSIVGHLYGPDSPEIEAAIEETEGKLVD